MGQEFAFGLEQPVVGADLPERQVAGDVMGDLLGGGEVDGGFAAVVPATGLDDRGVQGVGHVGLRPDEAGAGACDLVGGVGLRRVGHQTGGVIRVVGVAVQGAGGEVFAGVFEVVLLPPTSCHPVGDLRGGQVDRAFGELIGRVGAVGGR